MTSHFRWCLLSPGDKVLVAVSGGPDSLNLLHLLWTECEARQIVVEAAHLDHGLRGEESAAEAQWVAAWCGERGIACHVGLADAAAWASAHQQSIQEAARAVRYAFLVRTAADIGADKIATGHTRGDQAETVLGNILRGTGIDGLRGIPERRGLFIRPMLGVSRAEVEAYCEAHGLSPRQDSSNLSSDHYTRNRLRLTLLPLLRREYNLRVDEALLRLSEIAARDSDYLAMQAAAALAEATISASPDRLALDVGSLRLLHPALLRYVVRQAVEQVRGTADGLSYSSVERLYRNISGMTAGRGGVVISGLFPLPGCRVSLSPTVLRLEPEQIASAALTQEPVRLPVPGEAALKEIGWTITASWTETVGAVRVAAEAVDLPSLVVRNRRSGDKIDPLGMNGRHKKVSDIFSDAKVPRTERPLVPIVADRHGLVWIAGHTLAERAKETSSTTKLFLSARKPAAAEKPAGNTGGGME